MPAGFYPGSELKVVNPISRTAKCGACGFYKGCQSPKMEVSGGGRRKVLIVGDAPGAEEDRKGVQFKGKTGQFLEHTLTRIGVDMRKDCWLTNALICRPPGDTIKDKQAVDYCRPNLIHTIEDLQPDVVLLLGDVALRSLIPYVWANDVDSVDRWAGFCAPSTKINAWVCPTFHPSDLTKIGNPTLDNIFVSQLKKVFSLKGKPWKKVPNYESQIESMYEVKPIVEFLDSIKTGIIAFDYETNMLKPDGEQARIVSCSVCVDGDRTVAFPMLGRRVEESLRRLLADENVSKIASNLKFEDRWSRAILGVRVNGWIWDTMVNAHLLDQRPGITSIKFLSFVYCGIPLYDSHLDIYLKSKKKGGNEPNRIEEVGLPNLLKYNGLDSLLEYLVAEKQVRQMGFGNLSALAR